MRNVRFGLRSCAKGFLVLILGYLRVGVIIIFGCFPSLGTPGRALELLLGVSAELEPSGPLILASPLVRDLSYGRYNSRLLLELSRPKGMSIPLCSYRVSLGSQFRVDHRVGG